jgi:hypothetical protein
MERRHKSVTRNRRSGVNKDAAGKVGVGSSSELPHIAELISDGEITVGTLVPVGCVGRYEKGGRESEGRRQKDNRRENDGRT